MGKSLVFGKRASGGGFELSPVGCGVNESKDLLGMGGWFVLSPRVMLSTQTIEWPDEVEVLVDHLESEVTERGLTREEQAVLDIYETIPVLESEDGLHEFWQSSLEHQRIINSFELVGATAVVDPLNASRWCQSRPGDRSEYSETEADHLATIEEELVESMEDLVEVVMDFIEEELA